MMSTQREDTEIEIAYEVEDGEIPDSDVEDGEYVPLHRPDNFNQTSIMKMHIEDNQSEESSTKSSASDSDSSSGPGRPKKSKTKFRKTRIQTSQNSLNKKKYDIWSKPLQEDILTEDMISCDVTKSRDLGVESYDFTLKYRMDKGCDFREKKINDSFNKRKNNFRNKRTNADRENVKLRLGTRKSYDSDHNEKKVAKFLPDLSVEVHDPVADITSDIALNLQESKEDLISKVVEILGPSKAIELYLETKKIEADGGIMVVNGSRRRTPGGVYILLIKRDRDITKEMMDKIFKQEKNEKCRQKKMTQAKHRQQKVEQLKLSLTDADLPKLLSRVETATIGASRDEGSAGEGEEVRGDEDARRLSNPPPSPVTDGRDGSSDTDTQRSPRPPNSSFNIQSPVRCSSPRQLNLNTLQPLVENHLTASPLELDKRAFDLNTSYDDDFLDVNCSEEMELF